MKREGKTDANRSKGGGVNGKKHEVKKRETGRKIKTGKMKKRSI